MIYPTHNYLRGVRIDMIGTIKDFRSKITRKMSYGVSECNYMNCLSNHLLNMLFLQSKKELLHQITKLPFRSKNKDEIYYVIQLSILALKFLFYFYCWRNAVKNDHVPPSSTPSSLG